MLDLKKYYKPIELDNGMVRQYTKPHITSIAHLESACTSRDTAAHYFISRYLEQPIDGEKMLTELASLQDTDPDSETYGNIHWFREEPRIQDTNAAFFAMKYLGMALLFCPEKVPENEKALIRDMLVKSSVWFSGECRSAGYYYPNKIASDGSMLMLIAAVTEKPELVETALDFWKNWLDYTDEYGWGWGENTSKGYAEVLNDAFETTLICMDKSNPLYERLLAVREGMLSYVAFHGEYEFTPSIRTYNFSGLPKYGSNQHVKFDIEALADDDGKINALTLGSIILHAAAPAFVPTLTDESFHRERIFGQSYASTFKGQNIRLGTISRFPVMCGCGQNRDDRIGAWGLSWQSMPVSAIALRHETSFLRYHAVCGGEECSHISTGWKDKTLFPDENIPDLLTYSAQTDNCAVVIRMVEHLANVTSEFTDEWYFQHFDREVRQYGKWFIFDYGDCALCLQALDGDGELLRDGERIRVVRTFYKGEEKLVVHRRLVSSWAIAALDDCTDIERQLDAIPVSLSEIEDLRYPRISPCLRGVCGEAVLEFDPDKSDLI